jgi:hypothetical protein
VSFDAVRDRADSANLDQTMASQMSAAGQMSPSAPAAPITRLHAIDGVYNGTYTGKEGPIKFKLTITQLGGGKLAGVCTVFLPVDSGTKGYTYSLEGVNDPSHRHFELYDREWDTIPPKDFEKTGWDGTFAPNVAANSARIFSVQRPGPRFGPKFEATWDPVESADLTVAMAAQRAVGPPRVPPPTAQEIAAKAAAHIEAVRAHADALEHAPPKQLASKNLVRKSQQYWDGYKTDMIREIFDGGFGAAIDENAQFQSVFCAYVEMFSKNCPDCLPADHQTVTVTQKTNRKFDQFGNVISEDIATATIEMDSRFVDSYSKFNSTAALRSQGMQMALAAQRQGGTQGMLRGLFALAFDTQKFFADHSGKSAAMRQLNENFLRAIRGEPSLQQSDGKIDGAQAETDKNLPPGRYARFVDGANAYFREREKAEPAKYGNDASRDTALCQRLAELYDVHMSREEEYYYANDFARRFIPIMGPESSCPDPAWPVLHPDVEQALEELK